MSHCKTVLVVASTFYPHPRVGAVRVTHFCRHLPEFGWKPVVLCRYHGYQATAAQLAAHVHPAVDLRYLNAPSNQLGTETSVSSETRISRSADVRETIKKAVANSLKQLVVPDSSIYFWRRFRQQILQTVKDVRPSAILTSSPPHSVHDIGIWLAEQIPDLPWIADFRDPYTLSPGYRPRGIFALRFGAHHRYERKIYARCRLALHVNEFHDRWARLQFPEFRSRMRYLPNGIPSELIAAQRTLNRSGRTIFCSAGAVGVKEILTVAQALRQLIDSGIDAELRLVGPIPKNVAQLGEILRDRVLALGRVPHEEALRQILAADVLLALQSVERAELVGLSSKLFEYLSTGLPIIVVNNSRPARRFLKRFKGVYNVDQPTTTQLAGIMRAAIRPENAPPAAQAEEFQQRYSRRTLTRTLAGWLDEVQQVVVS